MVDAFLESTRTGDAEVDDYQRDYGWPSLSETGSVVALAVRLRIGGVAARSFAWGEALRLAVLVALLVQASYAIVNIAFGAWSSGRVHWLPQPPADFAMPAMSVAAVLIPLAFNAVTVATFLLLVSGHTVKPYSSHVRLCSRACRSTRCRSAGASSWSRKWCWSARWRRLSVRTLPCHRGVGCSGCPVASR
jgi:hypothetical protein